MKTLDQLEARTPISSVPFTISAPGSFYLTRNLTVASGDAISITADDVTLDLNGFTISSTASPASGSGVSLPGSPPRRNLTIRNGHIRGTTTFAAGSFTGGGFQNGVNSASFDASVRVADLQVFGVAGIGIGVGGSKSMVEHCNVAVCGVTGIDASIVRDSAADTCGTNGVAAKTVIDSFGESVLTTGSNRGITGGAVGGTVVHSTGVAALGIGVNGAIGIHCEGTATSGGGVNLTGTATFCQGKRDGGTAIGAPVAIGCTVNGTGTVTSANKFLGTP